MLASHDTVPAAGATRAHVTQHAMSIEYTVNATTHGRLDAFIDHVIFTSSRRVPLIYPHLHTHSELKCVPLQSARLSININEAVSL